MWPFNSESIPTGSQNNVITLDEQNCLFDYIMHARLPKVILVRLAVSEN